MDRRSTKRRKWSKHNPPPKPTSEIVRTPWLQCLLSQKPAGLPTWLVQDPEVAVRCGSPIKTSINNINCWPTPSRNRLPRSKGMVEAGRGRRVAFNQYPRNAADG